MTVQEIIAKAIELHADEFRAAMVYQVRLDSVDISAPCSDDARAVTIGRQQAIAFEGNKRGAADWLASYPIGALVEVREIVNGRSIWIRSCMNKPALWADIRARGES